MVCVQLLCAAVAWPAFREAAHIKPLRERVIGCFFKSLTSQVSGIASAAREGLRHVTVSQPKNLPKEQLQMSLRPLLMNLANHKSLTLPLLKGLSQLLELLAMWFNPNLGDKLLDHLRNWLEPDKILNEQHSWKAGRPVRRLLPAPGGAGACRAVLDIHPAIGTSRTARPRRIHPVDACWAACCS